MLVRMRTANIRDLRWWSRVLYQLDESTAISLSWHCSASIRTGKTWFPSVCRLLDLRRCLLNIASKHYKKFAAMASPQMDKLSREKRVLGLERASKGLQKKLGENFEAGMIPAIADELLRLQDT